MKTIQDAWLLARKDLTLHLRDRAALTTGFLVPIALVTVFGWIMTYAFGGGSGMPKVSLWFVDEAQNESSQAVIDSLRKSEMIKLLPGENEKAITTDQLRAKIADGDAHNGLILPSGYGSVNAEGKSIDLKMLRDPGREMEDRMIQIAIAQATYFQSVSGWQRALTNLMAKEGVSPPQIEWIQKSMHRFQDDMEQAFRDDAKNNSTSDAADSAPASRKESPSSNTNASAPSSDSSSIFGRLEKFLALETEDIRPPARPKRVGYQQAQSVAGMGVMMLLFSLTGAGSLLLAEKESGTLKRLFALSISRESILLGKFFFVSVLGVLQMIVLFVYGELMFRVGLFRDPITLMILLVTWVAASCSFAMVIATFSRSAKQADSLATILILAMAALGGCWFPLQMMDLPTPMVLLTRSMMTYWAMDGLQGMLWNGLSWRDPKIQFAVAVQWAWAIGLGGVATLFYRKNYMPR